MSEDNITKISRQIYRVEIIKRFWKKHAAPHTAPMSDIFQTKTKPTGCLL